MKRVPLYDSSRIDGAQMYRERCTKNLGPRFIWLVMRYAPRGKIVRAACFRGVGGNSSLTGWVYIGRCTWKNDIEITGNTSTRIALASIRPARNIRLTRIYGSFYARPNAIQRLLVNMNGAKENIITRVGLIILVTFRACLEK